ncbi:MAG: hypothetical protein AB8B69_02730 [Chitinophagales bacterium]
MSITYQEISPLIVQAEVHRSRMECIFQAPGSSEIVKATTTIRRKHTIKSRVVNDVKRTALYELRSIATRALQNIFGNGTIGRTARQMTNTALSTNTPDYTYSEEEKQAAVLAAFKTVAKKFHYNSPTDTWATGKSMSDFERKLQEKPLTEKYDKEILGRMLIEIADGDGYISSDERNFLSDIMHPDVVDIDELMSKGALNKYDLEEVSKGAEENIMMLAWSMAFRDWELDSGEKGQLERFAGMFGFSDTVITRIVGLAQNYVIEGLLDEGAGKSEILDFAEQIKMKEEDAQRAMVKYRKRNI